MWDLSTSGPWKVSPVEWDGLSNPFQPQKFQDLSQCPQSQIQLLLLPHTWGIPAFPAFLEKAEVIPRR